MWLKYILTLTPHLETWKPGRCKVKISVKKFVTLVNVFGKEKKVNDWWIDEKFKTWKCAAKILLFLNDFDSLELYYKKHRAPVVDHQTLVFYGRSGSMEPGTEHKPRKRTPGPQAALMKSVCNCLIVPPLLYLLILLIPKQLKVMKLKFNWLWLESVQRWACFWFSEPSWHLDGVIVG